jgi:hypothetical protein
MRGAFRRVKKPSIAIPDWPDFLDLPKVNPSPSGDPKVVPVGEKVAAAG